MLSPLISGLIAAGIAAGLGGIAAGAKSLSEGVFPWEDPLGFLKSEAIGVGTGAVTGGVTAGAGAALGPVLGAAGNALGIGANTGTVAAQAGAATPQTLGGVVSQAGGGLLSQIGDQGSQGIIREALKNTAVGAGLGAARDPGNPLRGAASGAAGGLAGGLVQSIGSSVYDPGTVNLGGGGGYSLQGGQGFQPRLDSAGYSLARQSLGAARPTLVERLATGGINAGSRLAGSAGSGMVRSQLTPRPGFPQPMNPYQQWGQTPYFARFGR